MKDTKQAKRTEISIDIPFTAEQKASMADAMVDTKDQMDDIESQIKKKRSELSELQKDFDGEMAKLKKGSESQQIEVRVRKNFEPKDGGKPVMEYVDLEDDEKVIKTEVMLPGQYQTEIDDWFLGEPVEVPEMVSTSSEDEESSDDDDKEE